MANVKFTTKSVIIDGVRNKASYTMEGENLVIKMITAQEKIITLTLDPKHEHYKAAKAAFDEKAAKRAAYEANKPEPAEKPYKGMKLKGRGFEIYMDGSIDRATVTFKRRPSSQVRELVKAAGFYWSPNHNCWSRKLNNKAWTASQALYQQLA